MSQLHSKIYSPNCIFTLLPLMRCENTHFTLIVCSLPALLCLATTWRHSRSVSSFVKQCHPRTHKSYIGAHITLPNQGNSQVPAAKYSLGLPHSLCVTDLSLCWVSSADASFSRSICISVVRSHLYNLPSGWPRQVYCQGGRGKGE